MSASVLSPAPTITDKLTLDALRTRALHDAKRFRALAWIALSDGLPKGDLRAANARAAARSVIRHARSLPPPL